MYNTTKSFSKTISLLVLLFIGILSLQFQCSKSFACAESVYNFELSIRAYPDKDSILIGDTVWLEITAPTTLQDLSTSNLINYSSAANLGTAIGIAELLSEDSIDVQGNKSFEFSLQKGKELFRPDTMRFREYSFAENNQTYQFKLALIPKKKGVYKVFVSNADNVYRTNDKCTKAGFAINFKNTSQHLYLNQIALPGVTLPTGGGVYLFKVI